MPPPEAVLQRFLTGLRARVLAYLSVGAVDRHAGSSFSTVAADEAKGTMLGSSPA